MTWDGGAGGASGSAARVVRSDDVEIASEAQLDELLAKTDEAIAATDAVRAKLTDESNISFLSALVAKFDIESLGGSINYILDAIGSAGGNTSSGGTSAAQKLDTLLTRFDTTSLGDILNALLDAAGGSGVIVTRLNSLITNLPAGVLSSLATKLDTLIVKADNNKACSHFVDITSATTLPYVIATQHPAYTKTRELLADVDGTVTGLRASDGVSTTIKVYGKVPIGREFTSITALGTVGTLGLGF